MWVCARARTCMRRPRPCAAPSAAAGQAGWCGWSHRCVRVCSVILPTKALGATPVRESTGQPASRPVDRDVHNDPAYRPSASGQCLQCFPLVASVVHRRYSESTVVCITARPGCEHAAPAHLRPARGRRGVSRRTPCHQVAGCGCVARASTRSLHLKKQRRYYNYID